MGWRAICTAPSTPSVTNQTTITAPNTRPMRAVPRCCIANSASSTTSVSGTTAASKAGDTTSSPSTADSTEIAGVMTLSP